MTYAKIQTADIALAVAGAALAGLAGWRPGLIPAWFALIPIGVLVVGTLVLVPHQILVAHEGWSSARQARQGEEVLKKFLVKKEATTSETRTEPTSEVTE
jgi:hypothetical protein